VLTSILFAYIVALRKVNRKHEKRTTKEVIPLPDMLQLPDREKLPTLRELRKSRCMDVGELASILGVRENTVYRWERGACPPSLHDAMRIALLFKTRVEEINWWPHGLIT
jgi:DNA-binding XRE family transcriptional regulator